MVPSSTRPKLSRSSKWITLTLFILGVFGLAQPVSASVLYELRGAVVQVTDGSFNTLDLTADFQLGDSVRVACTIDPASLDTSDPNQAGCSSCVTSFIYDIEDEITTMQTGAISLLTITNDANVSESACVTTTNDFLFVQATTFNPPIVGYTVTGAGFGLLDCDGSAWSSTDLPRSLPPLVDFETPLITLSLTDGVKTGSIVARVGLAVLPVAPKTLGQVKQRYR